MAITVTDNRGILNEADATTGWSGSASISTGTTDPSPVEASNWLGMAVSNTTDDAYVAITSDDYSGGGTLFVWVQANGAMDTITNGGEQVVVGDGTNRIGYHVGGSDAAGFRHDDGPVKWTCHVLDLANKPANFTAYAGTEANLNEAAITQVGVAFKTLSKAVGGATNCFWDIIRFADNGVGIEVYGGTSGSPESLSTLCATDRSTGNQQAYGIIREVGTGVYSIQGNINLGDATSTNACYIDIDGETVLWEDRGLSSSNYYRFTVAGNGTGVTTVNITSSVLTVPSAASASFNSNDANVTCDATDSVFTGFDQGISIGGNTVDWSGCTFNLCGLITLSSTSTLTGCTIVNSSSSASVTTADLEDVAATAFTSDGSNHAVELTSIGTGTMAWSNTLTNYVTGTAASPVTPTSTGNEAIYVNVATASNLTINVAAGATIPSIRVGASFTGSVNVVAGTVPLTITVQDEAGSPINLAQTAIYTTTGTQLMNEDTNASGIATENFTYSTDTDIIIRVRKSATADNPRYFPFSATGVIESGGFSLTVTLEENPYI